MTAENKIIYTLVRDIDNKQYSIEVLENTDKNTLLANIEIYTFTNNCYNPDKNLRQFQVHKKFEEVYNDFLFQHQFFKYDVKHVLQLFNISNTTFYNTKSLSKSVKYFAKIALATAYLEELEDEMKKEYEIMQYLLLDEKAIKITEFSRLAFLKRDTVYSILKNSDKTSYKHLKITCDKVKMANRKALRDIISEVWSTSTSIYYELEFSENCNKNYTLRFPKLGIQESIYEEDFKFLYDELTTNTELKNYLERIAEMGDLKYIYKE